MFSLVSEAFEDKDTDSVCLSDGHLVAFMKFHCMNGKQSGWAVSARGLSTRQDLVPMLYKAMSELECIPKEESQGKKRF